MKSIGKFSFLVILCFFLLPNAEAQRSYFDLGFPSSRHPYPDNVGTNKVNPGIATGSSSGFYVRFGEDISKLCANYGISLNSSDPNRFRYPKFRVNVYATQGGFDSVKRLRYEREVQLAIVQSDLRYFADKMSDEEPDPKKREAWRQIADEIKLVLPLYREKVHILVRPGDKAKFKDLAGLMKAGATVNVGEISSGGMITCMMLEDTMTRSRAWRTGNNRMWRKRYHPTDAALDMLVGNNKTDKIDAVILVGGIPYPALKSFGMDWAVKKGLFKAGLEAKPQIALLPVGAEAKDLLCAHDHDGGAGRRHSHDFIGCYLPDQINVSDYEFLGDSKEVVETVGVYSCLVTHASYGKSTREPHKIDWVRHILYRILTKLDPYSDYGLPTDFGVPRAGTKWKEVQAVPNLGNSEAAWEDIYGWARHDDTMLRKMVDAWAAGSATEGGSTSTNIVDPIKLF
ncbi:MAG: TAXI family TRAP transporter solute-binding subunit [Verrucomicrobiales bacterium]|nr:TAXI family TRAP transporter solute-binding subunit [Verrucomicrobiales bacterium]